MSNRVWNIKDVTMTTYRPYVVYSLAGAMSKNAARRFIGYIHEELTAVDRVDSGQLRDSYESTLEATVQGPVAVVFSNLPPLQPTGRTLEDIVNRGTGIHGPYGTPIVSPSGRVMAFNWGRKSSNLSSRNVRNATSSNPSVASTGRFESSLVHAYSVLGQPATGFLDRAIRRIKFVDFTTPY